MKAFIIGVIMEDNSREIRTFYIDSFDSACQKVYSLYPNWVSIVELKENQIFFFLNNELVQED